MSTSPNRREVPTYPETSFDFRKPSGDDAPAVWGLIRACPPLDGNSRYCNLLQCTDFRDTCVLAEADGDAVGWISAYRQPRNPGTLFIWQVAVHPVARGHGLGKRMLVRLLRRPECESVEQLQTTVTRDNDASRAMFRSLARAVDGSLEERPHFDRARHFIGRHPSEQLITINGIGALTENGSRSARSPQSSESGHS